jgi:hypothetical protein
MIRIYQAVKIQSNFCDMQKDTPIFLYRSWMSSFQLIHLIMSKFVSHELLDYDRSRHALQKCHRDFSSISQKKRESKVFFLQKYVFACILLERRY